MAASVVKNPIIFIGALFCGRVLSERALRPLLMPAQGPLTFQRKRQNLGALAVEV